MSSGKTVSPGHGQKPGDHDHRKLRLGIGQITPEPQWAALGADNLGWTDPADLAMFASGSSGF
ncbi:MAG TPA: hypothetical protein VGD83_37010, partial [Streptosporangiaceae bacterium]